jgi:hypothetical protein
MLPALMPAVQIVAKVPRGLPRTVGSLCREAGIDCCVTGPAVERKVYLNAGKIAVAREPGSLGTVSMILPPVHQSDERKRAILALGILAYAVFDYVARESLRGRPEAKMAMPLGRPRKAHSMSGAERQRRWRAIHS